MTTRLVGMDREMAEDLVAELTAALNTPAKTIMLLTSDSEAVKSYFDSQLLGIEPSDYHAGALEDADSLYAGPVYVLAYARDEKTTYRMMGFEAVEG